MHFIKSVLDYLINDAVASQRKASPGLVNIE